MSAAELPQSSGPFRAGDRVQLTGPEGQAEHHHARAGQGLPHATAASSTHDAIIGLPDGSVVTNNVGVEHLALRPLLTDFVMSMPRGAAIIYPKDAAQILALADIFPGATVVEAGVGSGALSLWLLRAIGPAGTLRSFERRDEFAEVARANAATFLGRDPENWSRHRRRPAGGTARRPSSAERSTASCSTCSPRGSASTRSPTRSSPAASLLCYVATVTQLSRVAEAIRASGDYTHPQSSETMVRGWHVEGLAVRPDHRMIGHTGFLITARRLAPGTVLPELKRRPSKSDYSDDDVEAWTPGALGERQSSPKSLRKRVRAAAASAELVEGARRSTRT